MICLPDELLGRLDAAARARGITRSGYLQEVARASMMRRRPAGPDRRPPRVGPAPRRQGHAACARGARHPLMPMLDGGVWLGAYDGADRFNGAASRVIRAGSVAALDLTLQEVADVAIARRRSLDARATSST